MGVDIVVIVSARCNVSKKPGSGFTVCFDTGQLSGLGFTITESQIYGPAEIYLRRSVSVRVCRATLNLLYEIIFVRRSLAFISISRPGRVEISVLFTFHSRWQDGVVRVA